MEGAYSGWCLERTEGGSSDILSQRLGAVWRCPAESLDSSAGVVSLRSSGGTEGGGWE